MENVHQFKGLNPSLSLINLAFPFEHIAKPNILFCNIINIEYDYTLVTNLNLCKIDPSKFFFSKKSLKFCDFPPQYIVV